MGIINIPTPWKHCHRPSICLYAYLSLSLFFSLSLSLSLYLSLYLSLSVFIVDINVACFLNCMRFSSKVSLSLTCIRRLWLRECIRCSLCDHIKLQSISANSGRPLRSLDRRHTPRPRPPRPPLSICDKHSCPASLSADPFRWSDPSILTCDQILSAWASTTSTRSIKTVLWGFFALEGVPLIRLYSEWRH